MRDSEGAQESWCTGAGRLPLHIVVALDQNVPTPHSLVVLLELLVVKRLLQAIEEAHRHGGVAVHRHAVVHSCEAATTAEGEGMRASEKAEGDESSHHVAASESERGKRYPGEAMKRTRRVKRLLSSPLA